VFLSPVHDLGISEDPQSWTNWQPRKNHPFPGARMAHNFGSLSLHAFSASASVSFENGFAQPTLARDAALISPRRGLFWKDAGHDGLVQLEVVKACAPFDWTSCLLCLPYLFMLQTMHTEYIKEAPILSSSWDVHSTVTTGAVRLSC
jgi:hypothetical protein